MAKDRTPDVTRPKGGGAGASRSGKGGRTRPPVNVVAPQRPWGLIAAAVAVVVFAAAVIGYAVIQVNKANEGKVESVDEIAGITSVEYEAGPARGAPPWSTPSRRPIGGEHDPVWADCTGTVYDVDIRHENAVHSLEHGAVWITYDPEALSEDEIATLAELAGESGRMLSPYEGLDSAGQPAVVGPPAEGRLGRRPAGRAVRRLPHPQPRLAPRGRRQLREPGLHRRPAGRAGDAGTPAS